MMDPIISCQSDSEEANFRVDQDLFTEDPEKLEKNV